MKAVQNLKLLGVVTLLTLGLSACDKPGPAETAGQNIDRSAQNAGEKMERGAEKAGVALDDAAITAAVKAAIFAEPGLKSLQISVDTVNGVVTLTGSVDTMANSNRAKNLAEGVSGVKEVKNHLVTK